VRAFGGDTLLVGHGHSLRALAARWPTPGQPIKSQSRVRNQPIAARARTLRGAETRPGRSAPDHE
jgi:hypothetical protein